jgi:hypothetical protein
MPIDATRTLRGALAGAVAAGVWAAQQPLDKRAFGSSYDDVELLGRLVAGNRPDSYAAGLALHLQNGALFGALYANVAPSVPLPPAARGVAAGLLEHVALWPAGRLTDRYHPRRGDVPMLTGNRRAWWQAAWRHALFGLVLGELEHWLNAEEEPAEPDFSATVSSNGHGSLEHAAAAS